VSITCIASLELFEQANKNEMATRGDMKNGSREANFVYIQRVSIIELHAVERLAGWTKGFPNLRR
jgi:hypothetical protein